MTHRILPVDEWARLEGTPLGDVWRHLPTQGLTILVVEDDDGRIVGHWTESLVPVAEQLWVHPDHQKRGVVGRHLLMQMRDVIRALGASGYMTFSASAEVTQMLDRLQASRLPGVAYSVPLMR